MKKILELGNYIAPAYAGMILAEQKYYVEKWTNNRDPILDLQYGQQLWQWINYKKNIVCQDVKNNIGKIEQFDIVIDNFRPSTLQKWNIDPVAIASQHNITWVSLRSEIGEISFDLLAQCRSWLEYCEWIPFYVGDTNAGLWLAFKALAASCGHYKIGHASCLQKLVEGELILTPVRNKKSNPWDTESYKLINNRAYIDYKGKRITETIKTHKWKIKHLWHNDGRIVI